LVDAALPGRSRKRGCWWNSLKAKILYRIDDSPGVLARPLSQVWPLVVDHGFPC
jgi:hypothetical protein